MEYSRKERKSYHQVTLQGGASGLYMEWGGTLRKQGGEGGLCPPQKKTWRESWVSMKSLTKEKRPPWRSGILVGKQKAKKVRTLDAKSASIILQGKACLDGTGKEEVSTSQSTLWGKKGGDWPLVVP